MGEDHREIVAGIVRADEVLLQVPASADGQGHLAVGIHDVHRGDLRETVFLRGFEVGFRGGPAAAVGRVALDDRAVDLLHQVFDEVRVQVVVVARFACGELDGHLAGGRASERLVNFHQCPGRDLPGEVDHGFRRGGLTPFRLFACGILPLPAAGGALCRGQFGRDETQQ